MNNRICEEFKNYLKSGKKKFLKKHFSKTKNNDEVFYKFLKGIFIEFIAVMIKIDYLYYSASKIKDDNSFSSKDRNKAKLNAEIFENMYTYSNMILLKLEKITETIKSYR